MVEFLELVDTRFHEELIQEMDKDRIAILNDANNNLKKYNEDRPQI